MPERKILLQANELVLLEEAYETTQESPIIARQLAIAKEAIGELGPAIDIVQGH
jgi:hypothetical protein